MQSHKPGGEAAADGRGQSGQLGGARADFVASLGKKANDARTALGAIDAARGTDKEAALRDDLRRKLHALGSAAGLLRFEAMSRAITDAVSALDRGAQAGSLSTDDVALVARALDDLPALAWGEAPSRTGIGQASSSHPPEPAPVPTRSALVVGPEMLAEALSDEEAPATAVALYEIERTSDAQAAIGLARSVAPDVIVVDADVEASAELVEALLDDPMTEPVPLLVVGTFEGEASAARFVALGVAKAMTKPITAEALRAACDEAIDQKRGVTMRVSLGEPTLEQLGDRLAEEVRRALVESVDATSRGVRVPLGEGTEVFGAMWGAIARVREVVAARTNGAVRFGEAGPEGAITMAPWLHADQAGNERWAHGRARAAASEVRLQGRRVIVADDDPGVTWFIADLLRTAGCEVFEAFDGRTALELAFRVAPELVISDILMPGLDGFGLARSMRRDVALRDVPVILLSWKEDLLQRVRELGASAAAYLRKESDSRAIVARVRECLRPRSRVEARLRTDGEVRGRLDGLTVRSLLDLAGIARPNCRVAVRDASFLYEVEVRSGSPKRATRTAGDGSFKRGERVLAAMLGIGAGRFTVATTSDALTPDERDLRGSLAEQVAHPLAVARAAMNAVTGSRAMTVDRVRLDPEALESYAHAMPEGARALVKRLTDGASPRGMILQGEVEPALLEDVLGDLAARGAIIGVRGHSGDDVLTPAVDALLTELPSPYSSAPPPAAKSTSSKPPRVKSDPPRELTASNLADALMLELAEREPEIRGHSSSNPPPIIEPSELRPRSSNPPPEPRSSPKLAIQTLAPETEASADKTEVDAPVEAKDEANDDAPPPADAELRSVPVSFDESLPARAAELSKLSAPVKKDDEPLSESPRTPLSAAVAPRDAKNVTSEPSKGARWPWAAAVGGLVAIVIVGSFMTTPSPDRREGASVEAQDPAPAPTTMGKPIANDARGVTYGDLPAGLEVPAGQGLLEIAIARGAPIRIDGVARGTGPTLRVPLSAGPHDVQVRTSNDDATALARIVEVRAGHVARADLSSGP